MDTHLVNSWIKYYSTKDKKYLWAWEKLNTLVHRQPEAALEYIVAISKSTSDEDVIERLGQEALEDFIMLYGNDYIERIEQLAAESADFAKVLQCVWPNRISPELWPRIAALQDKYA